MKATVVSKRGVAIISFEGHMNYAHPPKIKERLKLLYESKRNKKVIFNLEKLEFIGSSGIRQFIEVLKDVNRTRVSPRFYGVSPEFQKLFEAYRGKKRFQIFSDEKKAVASYRVVKKTARA